MENKLPVIDGIEWQPTVTRNMSFWHQCLSVEGSYKHQRVDSKFDYLSLTIDGIHTTAFGYAANLQEMGKAVLTAVSSDAKIKALEQKYLTYGNKLKQALQKCLKDFTLDHWNNFIKVYRRYTAGLIIPTIIGRQGSELLMKKLTEQGVAIDEIENTVNVITYPAEHTPLFDSQLALLKIGAQVQGGDLSETVLDEALREWVDRYGHIPVNFCDESWTLPDARKQLGSVMQKDCATALEELRHNHETKVAAAKQTLEKIGNEEIAVLARALQAGTSLNEYRKNVFSWVSLHYRSLFAKIAGMAELDSWRACFYLYPQEMTRILQGEKIAGKRIVNERLLRLG